MKIWHSKTCGYSYAGLKETFTALNVDIRKEQSSHISDLSFHTLKKWKKKTIETTSGKRKEKVKSRNQWNCKKKKIENQWEKMVPWKDQ